MKEKGIFILSEVFYKGWNVYVNGKKQELYRVNYIFRGVPLEKGFYKLKFKYEPLSFKIGMTVSLISVLIMLFGIVVFGKNNVSTIRLMGQK